MSNVYVFLTRTEGAILQPIHQGGRSWVSVEKKAQSCVFSHSFAHAFTVVKVD